MRLLPGIELSTSQETAKFSFVEQVTPVVSVLHASDQVDTALDKIDDCATLFFS